MASVAGVARGSGVGKDVSSLLGELRRKIFSTLRRSLYVLRVDTGSCNGCEIEVFAALSPLYDVERFGVRLVISPRHADALIVTGPVTRQFRPVLERVYKMTPDPKVVIAVGACGCGGGVWYNSYAVEGGVDQVIPVDVYVPGCPPHPAAILHGVLVALDVLKQKIKRLEYREQEPSREWRLKTPIAVVLERKATTPVLVSWELYRALRLTARKYLGYVYGEQLLKDYLAMLSKLESLDGLEAESARIVEMWGGDKRVAEVLCEMNSIVRQYTGRKSRGAVP